MSGNEPTEEDTSLTCAHTLNVERNGCLSLSQASSIYDNSIEDLIRGYSSQQPTQSATSANTDASFELQPPPTQSSTGSKSGESSSTSMNSLVGVKRKASEALSGEEGQSKRPLPPLRKTIPTIVEPPQFRSCTSTNVDAPVVLSWPILMTGMFGRLPYGAQFELVRLLADTASSLDGKTLKYEDFLVEDIMNLKGTTNLAVVPQVKKMIYRHLEVKQKSKDNTTSQNSKLSEKEKQARDPWEEFDREEAALKVDPKYGAFGYGENGLPSVWYGGQVQFRGNLFFDKMTNAFNLKLEKPTLGPSCRFTRRFGSKFFFRIKLSKTAKANSQAAFEYLQRPHVVCGCVFRAFYAKDDIAFLFKTNEKWEADERGQGRISAGDPKTGFSFLDFIEWFNPLDLNDLQATAKWASRFSLGLSNSAPGYWLKPSQVTFADDIVCEETGSNMTDGAGSMNRALSREIHHRQEWKHIPTALQVRALGSKGLLVERYGDTSETPAITLTFSQRKIKYATNCDSSHYSIDVLRASHVRTPCRLSSEIIVNLAENGVGKEAFIKLLEDSLDEMLAPFLDWESTDTFPRMWRALETRGGVVAQRRARAQPGLARLRGLSDSFADESELPDDGEQLENSPFEESQRSSAWWPDPVSGCPSTLEETLVLLLQAGFTPTNCPVVRDKLKKTLQGYVKREIRAFRAEVPMSATAFIVPDTSGVLEEGEVFFMSSERYLKMPDGTCSNIVVGQVLLGRHPCKLPTDVQKWVAVDNPKLHHLVDVIVLSTKGKRRAADYLAGGDYDGDKALIMWQPALVEPFQNAELEFADEPEDMSKNFEKEIETVPDLLKRIENLSEVEKIHQLQHSLLGSIRIRSVVGQYSNAHDVAVYTLGYSHHKTRRLAFMFCMTLDGAKSGMTVKKEVCEKDNRDFGQRSPAWKEWKEAKDLEEMKPDMSNMAHPKRSHSKHGQFIMDALQESAKQQGDDCLKKIQEIFDSVVDEEDPDLCAPYLEILGKSKLPGGEYYEKDLVKIKAHVEQMYEERKVKDPEERNRTSLLTSPRKSPRKAGRDAGSAFTERPIEERQDILREQSRKFAASPDPKELHMPQFLADRVKASYAYWYDCNYQNIKNGYSKKFNWSRFPFDVAARELCAIKAHALGDEKTMTSAFYDHAYIRPPRV